MNNDAIEVAFVPEKTESTALVVPANGGGLFPATTPKERAQQMVECAQVFVGLARQRNEEAIKAGRAPLIVEMKDRKTGRISEHITVPLWRTLGALIPRSITATTESTTEIPNGWQARAALRTLDGTILGYADAQCTRDEGFWGHQPSNAIRSMAQTRAQGKAFRSVLDFLVVLAGFNPTPAEEMRDESPPPGPAPQASREKGSSRGRARATSGADNEERQRVVRRIFAMAGEYAIAAGDRGQELKDRLADKTPCALPDRDNCHNARHQLLESMYGKHRMRDLEPEELHDFVAKLERRIDEAAERP